MIIRFTGVRLLEDTLLGAGVILLAAFTGVQTYRLASSRLALHAFDEARAAGVKAGRQRASEARFDHGSASTGESLPVAVVRIEKANIRVPVFEGTGEMVLNRGAGWIAGTARPGEAGNVGIAGHRDGFFRSLKDVSPGDDIELSTVRGTAVYRVDQIEIVRPDNISVLGARAIPTLTLITCYPFDYIGAAPQRFVLHASLRERVTRGELMSDFARREPANSTTRR